MRLCRVNPWPPERFCGKPWTKHTHTQDVERRASGARAESSDHGDTVTDAFTRWIDQRLLSKQNVIDIIFSRRNIFPLSLFLSFSLLALFWIDKIFSYGLVHPCNAGICWAFSFFSPSTAAQPKHNTDSQTGTWRMLMRISFSRLFVHFIYLFFCITMCTRPSFGIFSFFFSPYLGVLSISSNLK
jgi:hypothetical protein